MGRSEPEPQSGFCSDPEVDAICWLSLLLVLKTNISKFQFDLETVDLEASLRDMPLQVTILFI